MKETDIDNRMRESRECIASLEEQLKGERLMLCALMEEEERIKGTMSCPRRMRASLKTETPDRWRNDGCCSYCGSLSPAELFKRIDAGETIDPTDKDYKVYVGRAKFFFPHLSKEEMQRFVGLVNAKKVNIGHPGYFYRLPFFMEQKADENQLP